MADRRRRESVRAEEPAQQLPISAVSNPILCGPYAEPTEYWRYDLASGEASRVPGRRPAGYYYRTDRDGGANDQQLRLLLEENWQELPLVNALREDVRRWRESNYATATPVTRELLRHWNRDDRARRLFFCQIEAVETIVYLAEVRRGGRRTRFTPRFTDADLASLIDSPGGGLPELVRFGCKMATGSGKTLVMAMILAWAFCNRGRQPSDERFPSAALVVCPNLTVKERLQVLRPDTLTENYFEAFNLVPTQLRPYLNSGKVLVTNWHVFLPESEHNEGGRSFNVVNKGPESADAFARRVLGDLYDRAPLLVLNDEAHHAYRPKPLTITDELTGEDGQTARREREEATRWIEGLDAINAACGVQMCVDLSATPFYLQGSGYSEGEPFPWLVSDFGLVDAIESGIVKIPRLPVSDTTGRPEPEYFRLWRHVTLDLQPGQRTPGKGRKPKPSVAWERSHGALALLAAQWKQRFEQIQAASPGQDRTPPVMIVVCDNTDIAEEFYRNISGEQPFPADRGDTEPDDSEDDDSDGPRRIRRPKARVSYSPSRLLPEFANTPEAKRTIRIDTKLLAEAEAGVGQANRKQAAEDLRKVVSTVGRIGEPGEQVRCVVSVAMLTEGWDANNVTHIIGIRAFGSQLLCEQVVGRGLRRMDYTPDPVTGRLTEEYVDVYGIPFTVIPFKGRPTKATAPEDRPKNHVRSLPERVQFEIKFPVVESFLLALRQNNITADVDGMERLPIEPQYEPTAQFVRPIAGYQTGQPNAAGPGAFELQTREAYYASTHLQTIKFAISQQVLGELMRVAAMPTVEGSALRLGLQSRHQLFPQIYRLVDQYVEGKVDWHGVKDQRELGLDRYVTRLVERMLDAIRPDVSQGEPPLLPILHRYKPIGTTADVDFKTVKAVSPTLYSQINQVVLDTATWESSAAFRLEQAAVAGVIQCYAKNEHLEFTIPYEYEDVPHHYEPDFLVRLDERRTVIVEIKGEVDSRDLAKHEAARRWESAVNNWGQLGKWKFHVCRDPQKLVGELGRIRTELQMGSL